MTTKEKMNPNKTARIAGVLYLLLIPLGVFGIIYTPSTLVVPGDAAATASKGVNVEQWEKRALESAG